MCESAKSGCQAGWAAMHCSHTCVTSLQWQKCWLKSLYIIEPDFGSGVEFVCVFPGPMLGYFIWWTLHHARFPPVNTRFQTDRYSNTSLLNNWLTRCLGCIAYFLINLIFLLAPGGPFYEEVRRFMSLPNSTVRSCSLWYTRSCYALIDTVFPGLLWSSSGSATGCLYLVDSRQWVKVLPSVGMTKPGHSTSSHSQQKISEAASLQYVCAGHLICEWQTTHFPEHASVATLQKVFFSLCEGLRCCTIGHGWPDRHYMP